VNSLTVVLSDGFVKSRELSGCERILPILAEPVPFCSCDVTNLRGSLVVTNTLRNLISRVQMLAIPQLFINSCFLLADSKYFIHFNIIKLIRRAKQYTYGPEDQNYVRSGTRT
jgi:hypothetical protein